MFTQDDINKLKQFKMIVNESNLEIKGSATVMVALLFQWFDGLGAKMQQSIDQKEVKESIKDIKPIKKTGKKNAL